MKDHLAILKFRGFQVKDVRIDHESIKRKNFVCAGNHVETVKMKIRKSKRLVDQA